MEKQPRKVLLHCGNNDLDKEIEIDILKKEIKEVVEVLRQLFTKSQIVISSLFPRGEIHLEEKIKGLNLYMEELTLIIPNSLFMNNKEVRKKMLQNDNN